MNALRCLSGKTLACWNAGFSTAFSERGPARRVVAALKAYQNPDGGFGYALEPDKRVPDSQPVDVEVALRTLDLAGALAETAVRQELVLPACEFLASITTPEGGVPLSLPSAKRYPHAPWWAVDDNPPASLNPTASIAGLLLKNGIEHPWLDGAVAYCWRAIAASETEDFHYVMPMITFLEHASDRERAGREFERIAARVGRPGVVEMDPGALGYVHKPLEWAPAPDSLVRRLFDDETLARHLAALAARQQPDGGWPITWQPMSPGVELEWRGRVTIEALLTLDAYAAAGLDVAG